jgi:hypothetical protein
MSIFNFRKRQDSNDFASVKTFESGYSYNKFRRKHKGDFTSFVFGGHSSTVDINKFVSWLDGKSEFQPPIYLIFCEWLDFSGFLFLCRKVKGNYRVSNRLNYTFKGVKHE